RPPISSFLPYTTLFRSFRAVVFVEEDDERPALLGDRIDEGGRQRLHWHLLAQTGDAAEGIEGDVADAGNGGSHVGDEGRGFRLVDRKSTRLNSSHVKIS